MPENRQKSIFLFFQTIMDKIFGIFSVVDNYNENHKSFQSPLHGLKPNDFSFSFSYWPWAFGSLDLRIGWAENGRNGANMKRLRQQSAHIKGFSSTIKVAHITIHFVRADFSMFADLRQKCQYIMSLIVWKIRKSPFLKNPGTNSIFQY